MTLLVVVSEAGTPIIDIMRGLVNILNVADGIFAVVVGRVHRFQTGRVLQQIASAFLCRQRAATPERVEASSGHGRQSYVLVGL